MQTIICNWFDKYIKNFNKDQLQNQYNITLKDCYAGNKYGSFKQIDIQNYVYQNVKFTCIMFTMNTDNKLMMILDSTKRWCICNHNQVDHAGTLIDHFNGDNAIPMVGIWCSIDGTESSVCMKNSTFALKIFLNTWFEIKLHTNDQLQFSQESIEFVKEFIEKANLGKGVGNTLASFVIYDREEDMKKCYQDGTDLTNLHYWTSKKYDDSKKIEKAVDLMKGATTVASAPPEPIPAEPVHKSPVCSEKKVEKVEKVEKVPANLNMMKHAIDFMNQFNNFAMMNKVNVQDYQTVMSKCSEIMQIISRINGSS